MDIRVGLIISSMNHHVIVYKVAIQWGLLVEFSCDPHIDSLLRALLVYVTISFCN